MHSKKADYNPFFLSKVGNSLELGYIIYKANIAKRKVGIWYKQHQTSS